MTKRSVQRSVKLLRALMALGVFSCGFDSREVQTVGPGARGGQDTLDAGSGGSAGADSVGMDLSGTSGSPSEQPGALATPLDGADMQAGGAVRCDESGSCECQGDGGACEPLPLPSCDAGADCAPGCTGCTIADECVGAGATNPVNPCEVCAPTQNPVDWSNAEGVSCDDGAFCTTEDTCRDRVCSGTPRRCEDGVACNGDETCDEAADTCAAGQLQCGTNAVCDLITGACVNTCNGCIINGTCVPSGVEQAGNPCFVCDPARSTTQFSAVAGKSCGAGPGTCSGQDTCNANGVCQPNHQTAGTPCGNSASGACNAPDTCNGEGACQSNLAANGSTCSDGLFCTSGDACQGGSCTPTGLVNCGGSALQCNNAAGRCECTGCTVNGVCLAAGTVNPNNSCQICDPTRATSGFSPNAAGTLCGEGPVVCSNQDTCNAQGLCVPNHAPVTQACAGGNCNGNGGCQATPAPPQCDECETLQGNACVPVGGDAPCSVDDRAGRCHTAGVCSERCVVGVSRVGCLAQ